MIDSKQALRPLDLEGVADSNTAVVAKIAKEHHVRRSTARRWFIEMLKFLDVCAQVDMTASPSVRVDKAWHTFILFTRPYAEYCQRRFGFFIHHEPFESSDHDAYTFTYLEVRAMFGQIDKRVWPPPRVERSSPLRGLGGLGGGGAGCFGGGGGCGGGGGGCGGGGGG